MSRRSTNILTDNLSTKLDLRDEQVTIGRLKETLLAPISHAQVVDNRILLFNYILFPMLHTNSITSLNFS